MTRHETIGQAITLSLLGMPEELSDILKTLVQENHIPLDRLIQIARRQFLVPDEFFWQVIMRTRPELIQ